MELNELYSEVITYYSRSQKHRKHLEAPTVTMRGFNPSCGDDIYLELDIQDDIIKKAAVIGDGCAISMASASVMADLIEGKKTEEACRLMETFIGMIQKTVTDEKKLEPLEDAVAFRNISNMPARVKCAVLAWHTLDEALKKREEKL